MEAKTQDKKEQIVEHEKVKGINTALSGISSVLPRLNTAIDASSKAVTSVTERIARLEARAAKEADVADMMALNPAWKEALKAKEIGGTQKAVTDEIAAIRPHIDALNALMLEIGTKYGVPVVTVAQADKTGKTGKGIGTITEAKKAELTAALTARGYIGISFSDMGDGAHYLCKAQSPEGQPRSGRYADQILKDW